jgi:hypothetical protein
MLAAEGGLLAALGALAGLVAGSAISLVLVFVVNRQSFNWGMEMHFLVLLLGAYALVLVVLAIVTAVLSGREAMSLGPVSVCSEPESSSVIGIREGRPNPRMCNLGLEAIAALRVSVASLVNRHRRIDALNGQNLVGRLTVLECADCLASR